MNCLTLFCLIFITINYSNACNNNNDCVKDGTVMQCINGHCNLGIECLNDIDCLIRGINFVCVRNKCSQQN